MHVPTSLTALSEIVGTVYDSAVDHSLWPTALDAMRCEMRFATAALNTASMPNGRLILKLATGMAPYWLARMSMYDNTIIDLWGGTDVAASLPLAEPVILSRVNPVAFVAPVHPYIAEWGHPQGLIDTMGIVIARDGETVGAVAFGRHGDQGEIGEAELAFGRLLGPHLQRAAVISRLLQSSEGAVCFAALVGKLALPIILVDSNLRVLHLNDAADGFLRDGLGLQLRERRLAASDPLVIGSLLSAARTCALQETSFVNCASGIPLRYSEDQIAVIHVLPLPKEGLRAKLDQTAVAALLIAKPVSWSGAAHDTVAALYELTPTETRVFRLIASGSTTSCAARALGVAPSTLKTHLLRIFDKLGVHRQTDLVRLALAFASPVS